MLSETGFGLELDKEVSETKIPYYAIKLTPEQAKEIEGKKPEIFDCDGHKVFDLRSKAGGVISGEKMIYVIFR